MFNTFIGYLQLGEQLIYTLNVKGHKQGIKQMKLQSENILQSDIGYIFECCLNNGNYYGNYSIFNHNLNIQKDVLIEYLNQCILYLTLYTFSINEFIDILLKYINIPSAVINNNYNEFNENFFISYCILFRNIAENMNNIIEINNGNINPLEYYMFTQKLCLNDIIISLSELKQ